MHQVQVKTRSPHWFSLSLATFGCSLLPPVLAPTPAFSAERIYVTYGVIQRSFPINALEIYAREGRITPELAGFTRYANDTQRGQLREALQQRIPLTSLAVSQFLYSPIGETLLRRLGDVIQTEAGQSGFYALRGALILAAADPQGLTLLNILRRFPTPGVRVNLEQGLAVMTNFNRLVDQTAKSTAAVNQAAASEASTVIASSLDELPLLSEKGPYQWQRETLTFSRPISIGRQPGTRTFVTDIYLPVAEASQAQAPYPVVVISHGLGLNRTSFTYLAQSLASHGFAVLVPEHPGSGAEQLQALLSGRSGDVTAPNEFVDRPLDVKFLLDDLTQRSQVDNRFRGQLDLQRVGVIGQSFGGYTSLALAGGAIDFPRLQRDCAPRNNSLNLSLLLQCRALQLPQRNYTLQDNRIKAAIAVNPTISSVLGPTNLAKIRVPVMLVASSADSAAPALPEQIQPFTWLTTVNKYLALLNGGTHFSTIGESEPGSGQFALPEPVVGPDPAIARRYLTLLELAFFKTYVAEQPAYRPYLSSAYASRISRPVLPLSLVRSFTANQLSESLKSGQK